MMKFKKQKNKIKLTRITGEIIMKFNLSQTQKPTRKRNSTTFVAFFNSKRTQ